MSRQLSMKFFKTTPQQLPPGLLEELRSWMVKTPTYSELATRPGCVHTTAAWATRQSPAGMLQPLPCEGYGLPAANRPLPCPTGAAHGWCWRHTTRPWALSVWGA